MAYDTDPFVGVASCQFKGFLPACPRTLSLVLSRSLTSRSQPHVLVRPAFVVFWNALFLRRFQCETLGLSHTGQSRNPGRLLATPRHPTPPAYPPPHPLPTRPHCSCPVSYLCHATPPHQATLPCPSHLPSSRSHCHTTLLSTCPATPHHPHLAH